MSHLGKRKIIGSKVIFHGIMLIPRRVIPNDPSTETSHTIFLDVFFLFGSFFEGNCWKLNLPGFYG